ncbi:redox-sensing transcriptional repressor Rex [Anaerobaca lacustris]|uniref:Redox-sensing transcriptional repressor Rex n=1 Tax=Anaerobaca lacustris TaxID=3044600 RepID=A0AAW6U6A5_9BACT|nr:redox-sensing transcriptional repressor Rex [Sedimentisphaerales bacterium M17dextr]
MRYRKIPDEAVRRLPVYLRAALHLSGRGIECTSSQGLADFIGVEPWQIRKDFSYFGDFGVPGVGYNLSRLIKHVNRILRLDTGPKAALVGVGNLGTALLTFPGFRMYGLEIAAAFDIDKRKIGRRKAGVLIEDVAALSDLRTRGIDLGIVAVPEATSQQVIDALAQAGIKGILNFSPRHVVVPRGMKVITIDIAMDLARLPYYVPAG